jgi:HEAT repeat protein
LIEILGDEDAQVRKASTEALVAIGKPSVKPLNAALASENPLIRTAAKEAISRWRELHVGDTIPVAAAETGEAE